MGREAEGGEKSVAGGKENEEGRGQVESGVKQNGEKRVGRNTEENRNEGW